MFDFRRLVRKYSKPMPLEEEIGGQYDYQHGGKWKPTTQTREVIAAAFNLSGRDARSYSIQYGEGGSYTTEDIKIYIHEPLIIGSVITWKDNKFTISSQVDHEDHANGLMLYVARRAGKIQNAG